MRNVEARVASLQLDPAGQAAAWIECPHSAIPEPGRYALGVFSGDEQAVLPTVLFAGEISNQGFLAVPPIPPTWTPGCPLILRSPLGQGFKLPAQVRRLALAACGDTLSRLYPLAAKAAALGADVAWFTDAPTPVMPAAFELNELSALPDGVRWADWLAVDLPLERLGELGMQLGYSDSRRLPCPGQALIVTPMPCGAVGECGACAVPMRRGYQLACTDGPVFDLHELAW